MKTIPIAFVFLVFGTVAQAGSTAATLALACQKYLRTTMADEKLYLQQEARYRSICECQAKVVFAARPKLPQSDIDAHEAELNGDPSKHASNVSTVFNTSQRACTDQVLRPGLKSGSNKGN